MNGEVLPGIPGTTGELAEFLPGGNPPDPYDTSVGRGENNTLGIIFERGKITNTRCDTETKTENRLRLSMQNRFYYAEFVWSSGIGVLRLIL